jgi:hypothetical protein
MDKLLRQRWRRPAGGALKVDTAAIDAGDGGHYDRVLAFCIRALPRGPKGSPSRSGEAECNKIAMDGAMTVDAALKPSRVRILG